MRKQGHTFPGEGRLRAELGRASSAGLSCTLGALRPWPSRGRTPAGVTREPRERTGSAVAHNSNQLLWVDCPLMSVSTAAALTLAEEAKQLFGRPCKIKHD